MVDCLVNVFLHARDWMYDDEWSARPQNQAGRVGPFSAGWKRGTNKTLTDGRHLFNIITEEIYG